MSGLPFDLAPLVPEAYAAYRTVLADALVLFLGRLPASRRGAIFAEQARLPLETGLAERFTRLLRHCPTLHKLGQVLARDRRLDPELRRWLQTLESLPPPRLGPDFRYRLDAELPGLERAGVHVATRALAEGSVARVVPFTYRDPAGEEVGQGVLKVLKPGVERRLEQELALWPALGAFLDERCDRCRLPPIRYAETLESVRALLASEVRLDQEQCHLAEAVGVYPETAMRIPRLLPFCTPRITAMERIDGVKVTETAGLSARERRRTAEHIVAGLLAQPLWSGRDPSLFHADPHAGNLLRTPDGTLAVLDWSLVGRLGKREREQLLQALLAAWRLDPAGVARAVSALLLSPAPETDLRARVERAVAELPPGRPAGFHWLLGLLDAIAFAGLGRFEPSLLFFRKSLLTLQGVLADVCEDDALDAVLGWTALWQLLAEGSLRPWAPPGSRAFGPHLSNLDLLSLCWATPELSLRYWRHWLASSWDRPAAEPSDRA